MEKNDILLTPEELAQKMQVHKKVVLNWARNGMPHLKINSRTIRFEWDKVQAYFSHERRCDSFFNETELNLIETCLWELLYQNDQEKKLALENNNKNLHDDLEKHEKPIVKLAGKMRDILEFFRMK